MKKIKRKLDIAIAVLIYYLLSMVIAGWLFAFSNISELIPSHFELPLYHAESIASDDKSVIFINSHYFRRIQAYNISGDYLGGWYTDQPRNGSSYLLFHTPDKIELATSSGGESIVFGLDGSIVDRNSDGQYFKISKVVEDSLTTEVNGRVYKIKNEYLFPLIAKENENGSLEYFIKGPWWQYLFPPYLVSISVILFLVLVSKIRAS